jgi:hypothetical protein
MSVTAYVDCSGPIFDGTAEQAVSDLVRDIAKRGAEWAEENLRDTAMDKTGRARGAFQANLHIVEKSAGWSVPGPMIRGVVWAPWLEGTSKRNRSTKFKGYHPFSKTRQDLEDSEAQRIADETLEQYLPRLGGEGA